MPSFVLWTKCKSGPLCKYRLLLPEPGWTRLVRCLLPTDSKLKSKQSAVVHVPYLAVTSLSWTLGRCGSPRCSQKFLSVPPFRKYRRKLHLILSTDGYLQIHLTSWRPSLPSVRGTGTNAPILSHRQWLCTAIVFIRVITPPSTELPATVQHALANALSCLAARTGLKVCVACSHRPPDKAPFCAPCEEYWNDALEAVGFHQARSPCLDLSCGFGVSLLRVWSSEPIYSLVAMLAKVHLLDYFS